MGCLCVWGGGGGGGEGTMVNKVFEQLVTGSNIIVHVHKIQQVFWKILLSNLLPKFSLK